MPIEIHSRLIDLDGKPHVLSVIRDITEQQASQQTIQQSRLQLDQQNTFLLAVLNNAPLGMHMYQLEAEGRLIFTGANQFADQILGIDNNQFVGKTIEDAFPGLIETEVPSQYRKVADSGSRWFTEQISYHEGQINGAYAVHAFQTLPGQMAAFFQDITTRKKQEKALSASEERWKFALEGSGDGVWDWNPKTDEAVYSKRWKEMLGYSDLEFPNTGAAWFDHLHPEDKERVISSVQNFFVGTHPTYAVEFRMQCKNGSWKWILARGMLVSRDKQGQPLRMIGTHTDLSERKQAEESLQLAGMVYANSIEAIVVVDANSNIIAINPAFTDTTGYTESEVIGKNPRILSSGRQDASFYRDMWRELNETGRWQGEIWNRRKNGEVYAEQLSINTIYHADGSVHRRIALFLDVTEKKKTDELVWRQANFDTLTGLPNRRMLRDRLEQEIKKSQRSKTPLAILFIDLDRFKEVNDTLGHHVGDELLIEASKRLESCIRESDTVGRMGGDEFTVLINQLHGMGDVERLAHSIIEKLAAPYQLGNELVFSSASVGIAVYPDDSVQPAQLLQYADQAMYAAKEQGRKQFCFFTQSLQDEAQSRLRMSSELGGALASGQFQVYFQPIVELATGRIFKAEALLRWIHPVRGMVSPLEFIPLAEETGHIISIGDWVFRESVHWAKRWNHVSKDGFQISVNKSPTQFRSADNADVLWLSYLRECGLSGRNICVEITESLLLKGDETTSRKLFSFRDAGIQVSIDDFGTGYSSLSYLKKFHIDYLKIDQVFVRNLVSDPADLALCEAIVVMAHKLGLKVIAEGVETNEQRNLLLQIGCDFGQGYLFAKPMPGEELDSLLANQQ